MRKVRIDVQADAMQAHPAAYADPDGGDLRVADEDADRARPPFAFDAETRKRGDQPGFEGCDIGPDVTATGREINHDIGNTLAGAVIGVAPAAAGLEHGEPPGLEQLRVGGAGASGVEGRVFEKPNTVRRGVFRNGLRAGVHGGKGNLIGHRRRRGDPRHGGAFEGRRWLQSMFQHGDQSARYPRPNLAPTKPCTYRTGLVRQRAPALAAGVAYSHIRGGTLRDFLRSWRNW